MTSRNSWFSFSLILDTLRKKLWVPTLAFLFFFFIYPVATVMQMQSFMRWANPSDPFYARDLASTVDDCLNGMGFGLGVFVMIGIIIAACVFFSYLHNKKQVDFYHSLPLKREQLFCTNFIAGLLSILIPFILNWLLSIVGLSFFGGFSVIDWPTTFSTLGLHLLFALCVYAVAILAGVLTGNLLVHLLGTATLLAVGPLLILMYATVMEMFYETFYGSVFALVTYLAYSSPVARWFSAFEGVSMHAIDTVLWLLFAVVIIGCTLYLYKIRSSEAAGHAMAFSKSKAIIKYPIIFISTFFSGILFHFIGDSYSGSYFWMIFGFIAGALLVSRLMEIIYDFDFKSIKKNWKGLGIFAVVFALFISVPLFDLTHYDSFLPEEAEVASIDLYLPDVDAFATFADRESYDYANREIQYLQASNLADSENIQAALSIIHKAISYGAADTYIADYDWRGNPVYEGEMMAAETMPAATEIPDTVSKRPRSSNNTKVNVVYHLKSGRSVARSYHYIACDDILNELDVILNSQEYKNNKYSINHISFHRILVDAVQPFENYAEGTQSLINLDETFKEELLSAYRQDLMDLTTTQMKKSLPVASLDLRVYPGAAPKDEFKREQMNWQMIHYPIYGNFDRTIAKLQQIGMEESDFKPAVDDVTRIEIERYMEDENEASLNEWIKQVFGFDLGLKQDTKYWTVSNKEQLQTIMQKTYPFAAFNYNIFVDAAADIDFTAYFETSYDSNRQDRYLPFYLTD